MLPSVSVVFTVTVLVPTFAVVVAVVVTFFIFASMAFSAAIFKFIVFTPIASSTFVIALIACKLLVHELLQSIHFFRAVLRA